MKLYSCNGQTYLLENTLVKSKGDFSLAPAELKTLNISTGLLSEITEEEYLIKSNKTNTVYVPPKPEWWIVDIFDTWPPLTDTRKPEQWPDQLPWPITLEDIDAVNEKPEWWNDTWGVWPANPIAPPESFKLVIEEDQTIKTLVQGIGTLIGEDDVSTNIKTDIKKKHCIDRRK